METNNGSEKDVGTPQNSPGVEKTILTVNSQIKNHLKSDFNMAFSFSIDSMKLY